MRDDDARVRLLGLRRALLARERGLADQAADIADARRDANVDDEHDPEGATLAFERAQAAALASEARGRLADVDDALARLDAGTYGVCVRCGRPIPDERLAARPTAALCVECQATTEATG